MKTIGTRKVRSILNNIGNKPITVVFFKRTNGRKRSLTGIINNDKTTSFIDHDLCSIKLTGKTKKPEYRCFGVDSVVSIKTDEKVYRA